MVQGSQSIASGNLHYHQGDVVGAAPFTGQVQQLFDRGLGVEGGAGLLKQFFVRYQTVQTVGRNDQVNTRLDRDHRDIDLVHGGGAQHQREGAAPFVFLRVIRVEVDQAAQLFDPGVHHG